jgi:hypothetical protein
MSLGMQTHPNNKIRLQFCGAADVKEFERRHYVRKMTEENRTEHSKAVGEVRGHHGQQIHYLIWYQGEKIGAISGGSAVFATKCRDEFFKITKENRKKVLNGIIDNTLFRLEKNEKNLASKIVSLWRRQVAKDWEYLYNVKPYGFETFVEYADFGDHQRIGGLYIADNWTRVGETEGSTKNHVGKGLTGKSSREIVSKKIVLCRWIKRFTSPVEHNYVSSWRGPSPEEKRISAERSAKRYAMVVQAERQSHLIDNGSSNLTPSLHFWEEASLISTLS